MLTGSAAKDVRGRIAAAAIAPGAVRVRKSRRRCGLPKRSRKFPMASSSHPRTDGAWPAESIAHRQRPGVRDFAPSQFRRDRIVAAFTGPAWRRINAKSVSRVGVAATSLRQPRLALLEQPLQLLALLRDAVGIAGFVALARIGGGLLDQLPDVVANDGDAP